MALFKVFKGNNASNLNGLEKHDGYSYYDTNATRFYIDAFYPPTTTQTAIIENYLTNNPSSIDRTNTTKIYKIPYTETVNGNPIDKTMDINFITKTNNEDYDYLVLDRRPINQDSITTAYFVNIITNATDPETGQKTDEIIRTRRALKIMYSDGSTTHQTVVSPVPNSTPNAIAFFMDADGRLSTTAAPYTGGDPQFLVDPEKGILTAPKFKGYIVAGSTTVVNDTETFVEVGEKATAEGQYTVASGTASHAEGNKTQATGFGAHAEGTETSVTINGTLVNYPLMASGVASHAEGMGNTAASNGSHAEGQLSYAGAMAAHAEGNNTTATGPTAHAEGNHAQAIKQAAHAEGEQTIASATGAHAEGRATTASGNYSHAEGSGSEASGNASHAEGAGTEASYIAHAEGWGTTASGTASHAEGRATIASGTASHAEGYQTTASGIASHAEGRTTTAHGNYSHAEGYQTIAFGAASHAEGRTTTASGIYSHVEGYQAQAQTAGFAAHAEGKSTIASATAAHAEGTLSQALGNHSHAEGAGTIASSYGQHVFGSYNIAEPTEATPTTKSTYVEIVGNGTGSKACSDARRLEWNGNEWLAGKLTIGANAVDPKDVPTLSQVQSLIANNGAMTFKGTIGAAADNPTTTALPAVHSVGWTYTVITANTTYAGVSCNIGDMIVCTTAGTSSSNNSDWAIIPNNADGKVLGPSSSKQNEIAVFTDQTGKTITGSGVTLPDHPEFTDTTYLFEDGDTGNFFVKEESAPTFRSISIGEPPLASAAERAYLDGLGTTTGNIAYYLDTSGTFGNDNNFNWNSTNQTLSALRLNGYVVSGQLKNSAGEYIINPGQQATAEGINTSASATGSHAEGYQTEARGSYAHAEGYSSKLAVPDDEEPIEDDWVEEDDWTEDDSQSETPSTQTNTYNSKGTRAIGFASHVEGYDAYAFGIAAHSEGKETSAYGEYTHAEGYQTMAHATASHAEGYQTTANNTYAHAEGYQTTASGTASHAEGYQTTASGTASHAEGQGTIARGYAQHVFGVYNNPNKPLNQANPYIEIVGNGTSDTTRTNARTLDWEGNEWLAGKITPAKGIDGYITAGQASVPDLYACPEGVSNTALFAWMPGPEPIELSDETIEYRTQQRALYTMGLKATAEGVKNNSHGVYSHTEGHGNSALVNNSHAEGEYTIANSYAAHTEGYGTVATGKAQHVFGIYNIPDSTGTTSTRGTYVEIVGNGQEPDPSTIPGRGSYDYDPAEQPAPITRSNARTLDWEGNEWLAGSLTAENNITTNGSLTIGGHVTLAFNAETNALDFNFI